MRPALLLLVGLLSACSPIDATPTAGESDGVRLQCFVSDAACTTSYELAMDAVDPRFAPGVVRATVRRTDARLCMEGDPQYDVELTEATGQTIEITVARMRNGELAACTY